MASFAPLLTADPIIQIHAASASLSLILVPFVLWRQKRDRLHKTFGYVWVLAMGLTALSSFGISNIGHIFGHMGHFSALHLLAVLTLWTLFVSVRAAIRKDIAMHKRALRSLVTFGLGLPAILNFLPGRRFSDAFFPDAPLHGMLGVAIVIGCIILWRFWTLSKGRLRVSGALSA